MSENVDDTPSDSEDRPVAIARRRLVATATLNLSARLLERDRRYFCAENALYILTEGSARSKVLPHRLLSNKGAGPAETDNWRVHCKIVPTLYNVWASPTYVSQLRGCASVRA
jgi:hypothetical protein